MLLYELFASPIIIKVLESPRYQIPSGLIIILTSNVENYKAYLQTEDDEDKEEEGFFSFEELTNNDQDQKTERQRLPNKERNHVKGHQKLMQDYFNEGSTYKDCDFERRFQLRKELFMRIAAAVVNASPYFVQKADCTGKIGLSSFQKITSALQQL
ncbi:hypothetical protein MJO29_002795, partial [Puccinia striiformis f. sp. tritici]